MFLTLCFANKFLNTKLSLSISILQGYTVYSKLSNKLVLKRSIGLRRKVNKNGFLVVVII